MVRTSARVCEACGYHHPRQVGVDVCENCGQRLGTAWKNLLQMQTVITRRRERISADEEERNRIGFELRTTYRFVPRGGRPGRFVAEVLAADGMPLAGMACGDAAEIRVTNLGRRTRKNKDTHGFWLDLVKGRWLSEKEGREGAANDDAADEDLEAKFEDVNRKDLITPYVEDRRNILVLRWAEPVSDEEAATLQYAIERGIEAVFQLEDSELSSELLPDGDDRGRVLLVEAAEGGAGVLRRVQSEPDVLARVAAEALRIIHIDPDTGEEDDNACVRGCYRCLLSYGNQLVHELIDRRLVAPALQELASATTRPVNDPAPQVSHDEHLEASGPRRHAAARARPPAAQPDRRGDRGHPHRPGLRQCRCADGRPRRRRWRRQAGHHTVDLRRLERDSDRRHRGHARRGFRTPRRLRRGDPVTAPTQQARPVFPVGSLVTARGREWVVLPGSDTDFLVLRPLAGGDDDVAGVFVDEGVSHATFTTPNPDDLGDDRSARLLRDALRIGFRASGGPFRSLASLAVDPRPYQLVPLLLALRQETTRLLIADDVGIGKTVEASLVAAELLAQGSARRLTVLCPPSLAEQWQTELQAKFGVQAEPVLPGTVRRLERGLEYGQSIFERYPFTIVSTDYIKSDVRRDDFLRAAPELVIVDEAHACVSDETGAGGRGRTQRYRLLKDLAADAERHLILVTATPAVSIQLSRSG